jgi:CHAT domain-containing protein
MQFPRFALNLLATTLFFSAVPFLAPELLTGYTVAQTQSNRETRKAEGDRLLDQGTRQYETAEYDAAVQSLQRALGLYREVGDRQGEVQVLIVLSEIYAESDQTDLALDRSQQALTLAQTLQSQFLQGRAFSARGRALFVANQDQLARQALETSIAITQETQDRQGEAWALSILSGFYTIALQQPEKGLEFGQQALLIAQQLRNARLEGRAYWRIGSALEAQKKYAQAIETYQKGFVASQAAGDRRNAAAVMFEIGRNYMLLEKPEQAISYLQRGNLLAEPLALPNLKSQISLLLADIYFNSEQYNLAIQFYQRAIPHAQQSNNLRQQYDAWSNLAAAYARSGNQLDSRRAREEALKIAQQLNDSKLLADAYRLFGSAVALSNDAQAAIPHLRQAIALYRQVKDPQGEVNAVVVLIEVLRSLKQYGQVINAAQQILPAAQSLPDSAESLNLKFQLNYYLADAYLETRQYSQAVQFYRSAVAIGRQANNLRQQYDALFALAATYARSGDQANSRRIREEALTIAQQLNDLKVLASAHRFLASAMGSSNDSRAAIPHYQQAIELYRQVKDTRGELNTTLLMLEALGQLERYEQIISIARQGLQLVQSLPNSREATEAKFNLLNSLADAYLETKQYEIAEQVYREAIVVAEKSNNLRQQYDTWVNLGATHARAGDRSNSRRAREEALKVAQRLNEPKTLAHAYYYLGAATVASNDYQTAISFYQRAIELYRQQQDAQGEIDSLLSIRFVHNLRQNYVEALEYTKAALQIVQRQIQQSKTETERQKWQSQEHTLLLAIAANYRSQRNYLRAIKFGQVALKSSTDANNTEQMLKAASDLIDIYNDAQKYSEGIAFTQFFLQQAQQRGDKKLVTGAYYLVAVAYSGAKDYFKAIETVERGLEIAVTLKDDNLQSLAFFLLSEVKYNQGKFEEAISKAQQALTLAKRANNAELEMRAFLNLGRAHHALNKYSEAVEQFQQGLAIAERTNDFGRQADFWLRIGSVYLSVRDFPKMFDALNRIQPILQSVSNPLAQSLGRLMRDGACLQIGLPNCGEQDAESMSMEGVSSLEAVEVIAALQLFFKSYTAFIQGDYSQSLSLAERMLALSSNSGNPNIISAAHQLLAFNYAELGEFQKAVIHAKQGVEVTLNTRDRSLQSGAWATLGEVYRTSNQIDEAIQSFQQSIALKEEDAALAYIGLGRIYRANQPSLAIVYYKRAINQIEAIRQKNRSLPSNLQEAFLQSVQGLGRTRVADAYRELADLLLDQDNLPEAEQVLSLLKVEELREYTRGTVTNLQTRQVRLSNAEQAIMQRYDGLIRFGQKIAECRAKRQCSEQELRYLGDLTTEWQNAVRSFEEEMQRERGQDPDVPSTSRLINSGRQIVESQPGTVLLYPVVTENRLWILWVTQGGVANAIQVPVRRSEIDRAVLEFRQLMRECEQRTCNTAEDIEKIQAVSQRIYGWLIPKLLEEEFAKNKIQNLVFALDRSLRYIPTAALFDGQKYLIERYTISTVTSPELVERDNPLPLNPADISVLALGLSESVPATENTPAFGDLPFVPEELQAIVRSPQARSDQGIFRGIERLNQSFDKAALNAAMGHSVLHIATHGLFVPTSLYESFLVLGNKQPWRISEIQNMEQLFSDVSLVVLSACETALGGRQQNREGQNLPDGREISGIAQSFINAGADTVVASLWQVNDPATKELMQRFYSNLAKSTAQQRITIASALQQAQLNLLHGKAQAARNTSRGNNATVIPTTDPEARSPSNTPIYAHPYYWSAFIIIGNGL